MKKVLGAGVFLAGYGLAWWSYLAITGRVAGTSESNAFLPSLVGLFIPGRVASPRLTSGQAVVGGTAQQPLSGPAGSIKAQDPNAPVFSQPVPQNDTYLNPITHI